MKNKLLVHTCCGPCLVGIYEDIQSNLQEYGLNSIEEIDVLWYNTNIHPKSEYDKRKETLNEYLNIVKKQGIFLDEYDLMDFSKTAVNYMENGYKIRCEFCYKTRLEKAFEYAKDNNYTHVTTTLLISPYQKHDLIIDICKELEKKYKVRFLYKDFRVLFRSGQNKARELGLYRQKYCGCIFSIDEGGK